MQISNSDQKNYIALTALIIYLFRILSLPINH